MQTIWVLLFGTLAVFSRPTASEAPEYWYLTTVDNWKFFKVQASGTMKNSDVVRACEAAGMMVTCHGTRDGCSASWISTCITYRSYVSCETHEVLSKNLCGNTDFLYCQPLDDTFVYHRRCWTCGIYAYGVDYDTHSTNNGGGGASTRNKFAICADFDECSSAPCQNGATCQDVVGSFTCQCAPGYTGTLCETDIDDCASYPCLHGTCTDGFMSYSCSCEDGWEGTDCDQNMDDCASNPCWFGGTCVDGIRDFSCVCPKGFDGKKCEIAAFSGQCYQFSSDALSYHEAQQACSTNSGHLADVKDAHQHIFIADGMTTTTGASNWLGMKLEPVYSLKYSDGSAAQGPLHIPTAQAPSHCDLCVLLNSSNSFQAEPASCMEQHNYVCQSDVESCGSNVCQNGGNCTSCFNGSSTFCDCPDGFEGKFCEINIDECASNPCQIGGTCLDDVNSYSCSCLPGYAGDNCESDIDLCAFVTCPFDWTCQDLGTHTTCLAPSARMQESYRCSSASCPDDMNCKEDGASFSCWAN